MKNFYNRIDELLKEQKKTKEDLANTIGLSSVQIFYNWKNLKKVPDVNTAFLIANFLNTSVEFLLTGKNTIESENLINDISAILEKYKN